MNYEAFEKLCKEKGTTPTALSLNIGLKKGNTTSWRNGGNPSVEVLLRLSDELNCTTDYLLRGNDLQAIKQLPDDQQELLDKYQKLPEREQGRILERMDQLLEAIEKSTPKEADKDEAPKNADIEQKKRFA